ncbi:MAG: chemotaxis response regulator protein-glutamate methylesterase [Thermodesulfobacteriota bacterium]
MERMSPLSTPLRVLIVDDSALFRKVLQNVLKEDQRFEVAGAARNGAEALDLAAAAKPDVMILDVEMPVMDGLETLTAVRRSHPGIEVIMFSSLTRSGAEITFQALEKGAMDFVAKPEADSPAAGLSTIRGDLIPKLTFLHTRKTLRRITSEPRTSPAPKIERKTEIKTIEPVPAFRPRTIRSHKRRVVALGISTGGPKALAEMMPQLPGNMEAGLLIVQHMPPVFTQTLAQRLDGLCPLEVREAKEGDLVKSGLALVAPGGRHMVVARETSKTDAVEIKLLDTPPENSCRPSADVLFRSVAAAYGPEAVGVIMTGMGSDGAAALKLMKERGAHVIAQNKETCTVFGMPKKPVEEGWADEVLPLEDIASAIARSVLGINLEAK